MTYAIVYSSRTGNTAMLAETLHDTLPAADCIYFGKPDAAALAADRLYVGFWTDRNSCDAATAEFLKTLTSQEVFLFGTCGFGESQEYYDQMLANVTALLPEGVQNIGGYMCQGKMPQSVRDRYERIAADDPEKAAHMEMMIANFDKALTHPDADDLQALAERVESISQE